ncbi:tetratricopeptide repeat protein [Flammeovirga agarivorans]|uniref:Tetratricopeptide repeat-containing protein n=1 Tax=Flammeovirga agarivorans TaxID=2726742 RepID=A0A7X8SRB7_9BACT|nr:hypothetical protein [Flammeovirga agarivorans]NLR94992.1 hypothetical protein [Flammeovirga agarivorans]
MINGIKSLKNTGLAILISNAIALCLLYIFDLSDRIGWVKENIIESIKTPLFSFNKLGVNFGIQSDSFVFLDTYNSGNLTIPYENYVIYGCILTFSFSVYLASISGLKRIWHAILFGLFAILIGTFHFENLGILNEIHDKAFTALVLLIYVGISFYYHIKNHISFGKRFLSYFVTTIALIGIIEINVSENHHWIAEAISYSFPSFVLISILFILFISISFPFGILYITTFKNTGNDGDSYKHFIIFYVIYILNLVYCYLNLFHSVDFDLYYLPPVLNIIIGSFIGLWLIQQQEDLFASATREDSILYWVYLGGALITLSTYAFHLSIFDTSFTNSIEQFSTVTMLGFGGAFSIYIVYNFHHILKKNLKVYKVAFQPQNIDFLSSWGVGLLLTIGLLFINNFVSYRYLWASYNNQLGDVELLNNNKYLAEERYQLADLYHLWNLHSNLMLGKIAEENKRPDVALVAYQNANKNKGIEQSYLKASALEYQNKNYIESLFQLKNGLEKFPNSLPIINNLSLRFYQLGEMDSAFYYLDKGMSISKEGDDYQSIKNNTIGLSVLNKSKFEDVSALLSPLSEASNIYETINHLALLNQNGVSSASKYIPNLVKDTTLNGDEISYIYNYSINTLLDNDPEDITGIISSLNTMNNIDYKQQLLFAEGVNSKSQFKNYNFWLAFDKLDHAYGTTNGYYNFMLGLEALQNNQFELAYDKLMNAFRTGQKSAIYPLSVSSSQVNSKEKTLELWQLVHKMKMISDEEFKIISKYLKTSTLDGNTEKDYFYYILFNHKTLNKSNIIDALKEIGKEYDREEIVLLVLNHLMIERKTEQAKSFIQAYSKQFNVSNNLNAEFITSLYVLEEKNDINIEATESPIQTLAFKIKKKEAIEDQTEVLFLNDAFNKAYTHQLLKEEKGEDAFNFTQQLLYINPFSETNTTQFIQVCMHLGLKDFAESAVVESEYKLSKGAQSRINTLYSELIKQYQQKINTWE